MRQGLGKTAVALFSAAVVLLYLTQMGAKGCGAEESAGVDTEPIPPTTCDITVMDEGGAPYRGAKVRLELLDAGGNTIYAAEGGPTDTQGRVTIRPSGWLPQGSSATITQYRLVTWDPALPNVPPYVNPAAPFSFGETVTATAIFVPSGQPGPVQPPPAE